jgi:uncharacterized Fe-S cluster-containing MiaB family protein
MKVSMSAYPSAAAARDRFVVERRGARDGRDPWRHQGVIVEDERAEDGAMARVATVFLTGRECPWRCVMCDLWRYTIEGDTPVGAIAAQIAAARSEADEAVSVMKLYNAGSFFDPRAVPESDYDDIAVQLVGLERVIVESHPALIGARVDRLLDALARQCARVGREDAQRLEVTRSHAARVEAALSEVTPSEVTPSEVTPSEVAPPRLEVAMGLETAHPDALERLHKRITLERFARAAAELGRRDVALRVFLLISPPFIPADEQDAWLLRSVDFAFECGASVVSLVPTRSGNGAMEALAAEGPFREPTLVDIERSFAAALAHAHGGQRPTPPHGARGRVFVDLWELERFADSANFADSEGAAAGAPCSFAMRRERLRLMNIEQRILSVEMAS